jgi:glycosyltransferase involved in cell wall biosynthesis
MFIAPSAYPLGGVAVWLDYLTARLHAHGWDSLAGLVAGQWHDVDSYRDAYPRLPTLGIQNPTGSAEGRIRALASVIEHVQPDVLVGVNIVDVYAASQRLRERNPPLRTVMSLHGIAADFLDDLQREAGAMDAVIATNRLASRLCIEHSGMPPERVFYAPYGVDVAALSALPRSPASKVLRIAWIGRLEQDQKRVDMIAPVLGCLDRLGIEYVFRIAGDGPERQSLLQALQPWIASGRVEYLGAVAAGRVGPEVYARADAFLLTSSWETGPIVIWEAMAAGVAVVSSRYVGSGLEGALKHEENCLMFAAGDSAGAALQLARLRDRGLRETLLRGGRNLVAERYTIDRSVTEWAACLDSVMKLPPRRASSPPRCPLPAGRLDRWFGVSLGESVRRALGVRFKHANPGGEWPHTAAFGSDDAALLNKARELDAAPPGSGRHQANET